MAFWWCLLFGATMFLYASCENTDNEEQPFLLDIVATKGDERAAMTSINNALYGVHGITVEHAWKVVGEPRVVAILQVQALCYWRPLEESLTAAGLSVTVKTLYRELDLETDLNVDKDLLASAPPPSSIRGKFIYFVDVTLLMSGQTGPSYQEAIRNNLALSLKYRIAGEQYLNYNVLGEFPVRMLFFDVVDPKKAASLAWPFNRGPLAMTISMTRVEHFSDYMNTYDCNCD